MSGEEAVETVRLRGAGGIVWEITLPLDAAYLRQIAAGTLKPVDFNSARLLARHGYDTPESLAPLRAIRGGSHE